MVEEGRVEERFEEGVKEEEIGVGEILMGLEGEEEGEEEKEEEKEGEGEEEGTSIPKKSQRKTIGGLTKRENLSPWFNLEGGVKEVRRRKKEKKKEKKKHL